MPVSALMIDIDDFKLYNDSYGHQAGDECLKKVAAVIRSQFQRNNDIVTRFGGEEFTVLLFNTDSHRAKQAGNTLCMKMAEIKLPHINSTTGDFVTLSVGVTSILAEENINLNTIISRADKAL